jgi:hypothetical protein
MNKKKDVIIEIPMAMAGAVTLGGSVTAVAKDKHGNVKAVRHGDGEGSYSGNYDGEICEESAEITNPKSKSEIERKREDKHVVRRLLPIFNRNNSSNFLISDDDPKQADIVDVFIEDSDAGVKIGVQVTFSDEKAISQLRRTKSLSRRGNAYQLFRDATIMRIKAKTDTKYPEADRRETVLALNGWPGVTEKVIQTFKSREIDFLKQAGYYQIWFVGITDETVIRLY